jgi:PAS domain S-box-containing protein
MRSEREMEYLLKAIDAFQRRMIVVSPHFEILAAKCNLEDITDAELVGKLCHKALYERDKPCENCAVLTVIEHGRPTLRPKVESGEDLEKMPCFYAYPIYDGGEIEAFVSMDFDLPTRGEIEAKLQNTNVLLRNLILSAVDGVIAADKNGRLLLFNETAAEIFGYTVEEALNEVNIIDIYPGDSARDVMKKMRSDTYGGRGKLRSYMVDVIDKNGEAIPINLNAAIVYENSKEVATIGFFHDMREILEMKEKLEKTRVQLLQAEKMSSLGKLAAGVAHQLNNPLGGITLFSKLILEEYDLEDGVKDDLNRILKDAKRCKDTVKELLEFTRQTRQLMHPHDINKAITRTLFLLENQSLFQNIEIVKDLATDLPLVQSDIQQLNHLFMNIILNAAQAMDGKGQLMLKTGLSSNDNKVRIEISDSGPGIPEATLPHIFEPFFTTKEEGEGTGLGLSLVYGIVENHGGQIKARNVKNKGAIFIIELPLSQGTHGEMESE